MENDSQLSQNQGREPEHFYPLASRKILLWDGAGRFGSARAGLETLGCSPPLFTTVKTHYADTAACCSQLVSWLDLISSRMFFRVAERLLGENNKSVTESGVDKVAGVEENSKL